MDNYIKQLIESQLASVEYRLEMANNNVTNLHKQYEDAKDDRDALADEAESLRVALPTQAPTPTQDVEDQGQADSK